MDEQIFIKLRGQEKGGDREKSGPGHTQGPEEDKELNESP